MSLPFKHERSGPGLHVFTFFSETRAGVVHTLHLDLDATGEDRLICNCEGSLYGRLCKHKRWLIHGGILPEHEGGYAS